jgi:gliding motility-associated-like protein
MPLNRFVIAALLAAGSLLWAAPASAIQSSSVDFTNTRSALDSGGMRKTSPSFRVDGSIGSLAMTSANSAHYRGRDGLIPGYYYPSAVTIYTSTVEAGGTEALQWISPGNDGLEHSIPGGYIVKYSSIASQSPALSDALFTAAASVTPAPPAGAVGGSTVTMIVSGLKVGVVYYFAVKTFERDGTRSALSPTVQYINVPQTPFGVAMSSNATSVTMRWMPTTRWTDGVNFPPGPNLPNALNAYLVFRATAPVGAPWTQVGTVSTMTSTWTDFAGGPGCGLQCYYYLTAQNSIGMSPPSVVRSAADMSAIVVAPDQSSYLQVLAPNVAPIEGVVGQPNSAYLVTASNELQDLGTVGGRVVKSVQFNAYLGGTLLAPNLPLAAPGVLHLAYATTPSSSGGGLVTPSGVRASDVSATPQNLSVYWYNGTAWVQQYGTVDTINQVVSIKTPFVGDYQLRSTERTGAFSFNMAGVSNRFLTPNGDHLNDNVVFTYDNPQDSAVTIKIFDMRGRIVASGLPAGPTATSFVWDGTSGGHPVPGGVYIYQIQSEGQTFSGTLVVIK